MTADTGSTADLDYLLIDNLDDLGRLMSEVWKFWRFGAMYVEGRG